MLCCAQTNLSGRGAISYANSVRGSFLLFSFLAGNISTNTLGRCWEGNISTNTQRHLQEHIPHAERCNTAEQAHCIAVTDTVKARLAPDLCHRSANTVAGPTLSPGRGRGLGQQHHSLPSLNSPPGGDAAGGHGDPRGLSLPPSTALCPGSDCCSSSEMGIGMGWE